LAFVVLVQLGERTIIGYKIHSVIISKCDFFLLNRVTCLHSSQSTM
jgi:hypothetical protein